MLTKKDRQHLVQDFKAVFATKDDLKGFATKDDLKTLAKQEDLLEVKAKVQDLLDFSKNAFGNLFDWVEDIHHNIVKKNLVKRVEKLEKHVGLSSTSS